MAAAGVPAAGLRGWVTPCEQYERVVESSPVFEQLDAVLPVADVAKIALAYVEDPCIATVSKAFEALRRIDMLPARFPALPRHIHHILNSKCPIGGHEASPDETPLKVWQTHSLYLIPPGTVHELEAHVNVYREEHLKQFYRHFWPEDPRAFGDTHLDDVRFDEPQWILMSNHVLPESPNKSYTQQEQMVEKLSAKSCTTYDVPLLKEAAAFAFLDRIATGDSVLQEGSEQNRARYVYTHVKETSQDKSLAVVGPACSGSPVARLRDGLYTNCGVVALRRF